MDDLTPEELTAIRKEVPLCGDNISIAVMTGKGLNPPGIEIEPATPGDVGRGEERRGSVDTSNVIG